ncbi:hypothetical protein [Streptomyces sp. NPDC007083]|uniref:hypothetical protein n=1 Tax=unclassified Streptomyces TaxID=2593676 RepID=UPI0033E3FF9F
MSTLTPRDRPEPRGPGDGSGPGDDDGDGSTGAEWTAADDRTSETLGLLHGKRRAHRNRRNRDLAVTGYAVLLMALGYGGTLGYRLVQRLGGLAAQDATAEAVRSALPAVLVLLACALAVLAVRDALWRGPVLVPRCDLDWLLTQPVRRSRVLLPAFRLSVALTAAGGALCAIGGAVVLRLTGLAGLGPALALCLPGGVCLPLLACALALRVERDDGAARRARALTPYAVLLLLLLVLQAVCAARGSRWALLETVELWSGPWGWAAQPVLHAAGVHTSGWPWALALLTAGTAVALGHALRSVGALPTRRLRARAATAATVASVLWSAELRAARLAVDEALADGASGNLRRLPLPRSPRFAVVRRDAVALLRAPGRVVSAALWTAAAAGAAGLAVASAGAGRIAALAMALALGWFAVGRLAETARLEADDTRRSSWSPFPLSSLMLQHSIVPAVAGGVLALAAAVPFALQGGGWALLLMPLCAPPFAAAAVLAAVRGPVRTELLSLGLVTPAGDASVFVFLFWYAAPFLAAVAPLTAGLASSGVLDPEAQALDSVRPVVTAVGLTCALLFAAARGAGKLRRPAS